MGLLQLYRRIADPDKRAHELLLNLNHPIEAERRNLTLRVIVAAILTLPVLYAGMVGGFISQDLVPGLLDNNWFQLGLITPVMVYAGWPIHRTGWLILAKRAADMNSLITIGTLAAFVYSLIVTVSPGLFPDDLQEVYYESVGVIITLIMLGRLLEAIAKGGTTEAKSIRPARFYARP